MKTIVYHGYEKKGSQPIDCPDGIISTALLYGYMTKVGSAAGSVQAVADWYLPNDLYQAYTPPDRLLQWAAESDEIWVVDFSYPVHWLQQMEELDCEVRVIDHHMDRLDKFQLANFSRAIYPSGEGEHCGATLTWGQLYWAPLPKSLQWVRQRDIGLDGYYEGLVPGSEAFNLGLGILRNSWRQELSRHEFLLRLEAFLVLPDQWREAIELGRPEVDERDKAIAEFLGATPYVILEVGGETFPAIQIPEHLTRHHSILAHRLLRRARQINGVDYNFAVSIHPEGSLSARSSGWDIRDWAQALGGGGHPKACGLAAGSQGAELVAQAMGSI